MKALVRSIAMLLIMVPLAVNAAPAKKPGGKKGHKVFKSQTVKKKKKKKKKKVMAGVVVRGPEVVYLDSFHDDFYTISDRRLRRLIRKLDRARGPMAKLEILARASSHRLFTVRQTRRVLREFRNERVRLEALKIMRTRIVDQHNFRKLIRLFDSRRNKRRAVRMLVAL